jgi:excinuclease ABC subunit C
MENQKPNLQVRLREVPHQPGVYVMRDQLHSVIYVGKARDLRKRLAQYFTPSRIHRVDKKTQALIESVWDFEYHQVKNEVEALVLEGQLIKDFRPKYNVSFKDDKRFWLVRIPKQDDFPRIGLTRLRKPDGAVYFGPYVHSQALLATLDWLNERLGLRVCKTLCPTEIDYKHCSNDIIKNCSAPCIGRITLAEYQQRVEQVCEWLSGKNTQPLMEELQIRMNGCSEKMEYERAAELRDLMEHFKTTFKNDTRQFERGSRQRVMKTIDPMADVDELQELLGLRCKPVVMECFDIANIGLAHCVASMVRFVNGVPQPSQYRRYRIRAVTGQNDFVSMAEVVQRRFSRILLEQQQHKKRDEITRLDKETEVPQMDSGLAENKEMPSKKFSKKEQVWIKLPDLVIVDGGKGQLNVAVEELRKLGLTQLPIVGLAKKFEEIYFPGENEPLRIPHDRGALKLLQRIRDEAHRWANGYHQLLLRRRVSESLLDECPGISAARKKNLLKEFKTVAQIRKASEEELISVVGMTKKSAAQLVQFLKTRE